MKFAWVLAISKFVCLNNWWLIWEQERLVYFLNNDQHNQQQINLSFFLSSDDDHDKTCKVWASTQQASLKL